MEAVARKNPATREELASVTELRNWQRAVLGEDYLKALKGTSRQAKSAVSAADAADGPEQSSASPYRD